MGSEHPTKLGWLLCVFSIHVILTQSYYLIREMFCLNPSKSNSVPYTPRTDYTIKTVKNVKGLIYSISLRTEILNDRYWPKADITFPSAYSLTVIGNDTVNLMRD